MSERPEFRHDVLNRIGAGVVIVDPRTRLIEWANPTAAKLFGASADDVVGQSCQCFLCPSEGENCPIVDCHQDADSTERSLHRLDGSELPIMKSVRRILVDGQEKLLETFVDISERKRMEEARLESEDRYRVLFESSREAMMVLAPPGWHFISANAATSALFGVKDQASFASLSPWNLSPATQPDGRPSEDKAREMIEIALREGSHAFEWRHRNVDGREIPTSVQLTRLTFAGQILVQATVRDLTPTELTLSALRNTEERLRLAVEATGMGTYHWGHATGMADYSPEFLALYDLPPTGALPLGADLIPLAVVDEDRPAFQAAMTASNDPQGDGVMRVDYRIRRRDGSTRWLMARGRTEFEGAAGLRRPSRSAGMIVDITERKRAEELAAVRLRLQEFAEGHTLDELLRNTVDEAERLTGSLVGFYHFVEADQTTLSLQAWSTRTREKFCKAEGQGRHYSVDQAGVWVDCIRERRPVIHNDYASLPGKKGLPEGHAPVIRQLVVPILRNNKIVAVLGVGNKASDYAEADIGALTYLADVAWEIAQRKVAEMDRRDSEEQLEKIFNSSTNGVAFTEPLSGKILNVNDTWIRDCGISRAEAIGKTAIELGLWDSTAERDACHQTLERDGRLREFEAMLVLKNVKRQYALNAEFVELRRGRFLLWEFRDITEHKRVEETLRRYELLASHSRDIVLFVRRDDGHIVEANRAALDAYGYSRDELLSLSIRELRAPNTRSLTEEQMARVDAGGLRFETVHRRKDGSVFPVEVSSDGVTIGCVRMLMSVVRDISERQRADEAIALLKHSIDVHYDAAYWFDSDCKFVYANETGYKALGFESGDLIGKTVQDVNRGATPERMNAVWNKLRTEGHYWSESVHRRRDGSEFPVEILTSYVQFGGKEYACGFARDITERRRSEAALRESEERFRAAFMTGLDAIYWSTLLDGRFLEVNPVFETVFGYSRAEIIGRTSLELGLYRDPSDREKMVAALQSKDFVRDLELQGRRKDGRFITISLSVSKVLMSDQQFLYGVIRDITESKLAEEEKARLTRQLQQAQKMESVGRLAGGVAHDFNNMLGVILGHCELALEKVDASASLHGDLVTMQAAAQRSADLTKQLLAFARKQTVAPRVLNLNDTVAGMLKMVRRVIGEDVRLDWRPGENLWPVKMDPTQIDQILANLCVNARDAIANVGRITIETGTKVIGPDVQLVGATPGRYVWITVRDDGCGMSPSTLALVFEPFFTTKEVGKGTGLGLATVYGIVKQNDGFIDLQSELGKGTVFTIYLPRHAGKDTHERLAAMPEAMPPGQETILLVEDEAPLLDITRRMLQKRGYKVFAASSPGEALKLARECTGNIELLITDVVMPEMNGRDLAKSFLSLYPRAKRLFMSGYTADVIAHQGVLDEGVHFIQKPFSAKDLAAVVRSLLDAEPGEPRDG